MSLLTVFKRYSENAFVLEEIKHGFYILKINDNYICVRRNGNIVLDHKWHIKTDNEQKQILSDFLGGMYIERLQTHINRGYFKTGNLNEILSF